MKLADIIYPELICTDLASHGKVDVLAELGSLLANHHAGVNAETITKTLVERERLATTGVGEGVAIPHGKIDGLKQITVAIGVSKTGIPFDAVDNEPVHIFVALLAPLSSSGDHLRALARISRLLKEPTVRDKIVSAQTAEELYNMVCEEDGKY